MDSVNGVQPYVASVVETSKVPVEHTPADENVQPEEIERVSETEGKFIDTYA